eukprot:1136491-Pelagomonas_calceolata.AAC.4
MLGRGIACDRQQSRGIIFVPVACLRPSLDLLKCCLACCKHAASIARCIETPKMRYSTCFPYSVSALAACQHVFLVSWHLKKGPGCDAQSVTSTHMDQSPWLCSSNSVPACAPCACMCCMCLQRKPTCFHVYKKLACASCASACARCACGCASATECLLCSEQTQ